MLPMHLRSTSGTKRDMAFSEPSEDRSAMLAGSTSLTIDFDKSKKLPVTEAVTPLPWRELFFISVIQGGQALQITMLLPIVE
eukprot:jgi/Mesen1/5887/ME000299S04994